MKTPITIHIDKDVWRQFRIACLCEETIKPPSQHIELLMRQFIATHADGEHHVTRHERCTHVVTSRQRD